MNRSERFDAPGRPGYCRRLAMADAAPDPTETGARVIGLVMAETVEVALVTTA